MLQGVSYFHLLRSVPYSWDDNEPSWRERFLFFWTYWIEFVDFIPIFPIMIHYSIVAFLPSDEEQIQHNASFWTYYGLMIIWVFGSNLSKFGAIPINSGERRAMLLKNGWLWWKAFLCTVQFFNFSYIRAKPFKFLVNGFSPGVGLSIFWIIHLICMGNAYHIRHNSIDGLI